MNKCGFVCNRTACFSEVFRFGFKKKNTLGVLAWKLSIVKNGRFVLKDPPVTVSAVWQQFYAERERESSDRIASQLSPRTGQISLASARSHWYTVSDYLTILTIENKTYCFENIEVMRWDIDGVVDRYMMI